MNTMPCDRTFAPQILDIFNDAIIHSTALYDYKPRSLESMKAWFDAKEKSNFPVIGIVDDAGKLLAFGSYGTFRAWPAYKYSIEHSIYVEKDHRGNGYGKTLLGELIKNAKFQNYHCMMAGIDSSNAVSIKLHKSFGFDFCGQIKQVGYKFGRWLDLDFYQLLLKTPNEPIEG